MVMIYDCCIGNFDGVHRGHQKLIARTVQSAREHGMIPAAIVFDPHPAVFLSGKSVPLLTSLEQKKKLLYQYGIEEVIIFPFDEVIASMRAEDFLNFVLNEMEIHTLFCGTDFRFGNRALGNKETLLNSDRRKFEVEVVDELILDERKVSSSVIRNLIADGEVEKAVEYLGHYYEIESAENVLPPEGKYLVEVNGEEREYRFKTASKVRRLSFIREL
ncbi:MAG: FAD synthetase family protein [Erysipelotrichaceae bacterium]|nr:FAD synthetase family protein [Erysipelotrichaceae bacterium]